MGLSQFDSTLIRKGRAFLAFDYKKEFKELYQPKSNPVIVSVPSMNFIAVPGHGDPNEEGGEYQSAVELLYGVAYTIKMSKKGPHRIEGYFDYAVPPLEGLCGFDYSRKEDFSWIALIRLPDFIAESDFAWAVEEATAKKKKDFSAVEFLLIEEGECVQAMHIGPYDSEPATVAAMDAYIAENGYVNDFSGMRMHHEIYLSDPRRTAPEKLKTVIRHPVKKG